MRDPVVTDTNRYYQNQKEWEEAYEAYQQEVGNLSYIDVIRELEDLGKDWDQTPTEDEARTKLIECKMTEAGYDV